MSNEKILQYDLWRGEIELNFKDEKRILGIHQAQVRTPNRVESFPGFVTAAYSLFLLAASGHVSQYPEVASAQDGLGDIDKQDAC